MCKSTRVSPCRLVTGGPEGPATEGEKHQMQTIQEIEADSNAQVVAKVLGTDVTRGELLAAFNRVANKLNWKLIIDALVELDEHREMAMIREAVIFFTGSVPTFAAIAGAAKPKCRYRVTAAGYYQTVGA
jgi:hypothetical protein